MDTLQDIINDVRGVTPSTTGTKEIPTAEPDSLQDIINTVRVDGSPMNQQPIQIPGFTGHNAHPMLVKVAQEYYQKADPEEALSTWVSDQTWNNANAASALWDAVKAQTVDPLKAKQMAFLGEQFDNLPSFWEGDRPITEKASRLWANIWRGVADPITWAGGAVGGKIASKVIGEGAGILARSAGAAVSDAVAGGVADVSQQTLQKSIGTREEYDPLQTAESALAMGAMGAGIRGGAGAIKKGWNILRRPDAEPKSIIQDNKAYPYQAEKANIPAEDQSNAMGVLVDRENIPAPENENIPLGNVNDNLQTKFNTDTSVKPYEGVLQRREPVLEGANTNKFPDMEVTRPIEGAPDSIMKPGETSLASIENDLGYGDANFGGLQHLEGSLEPKEPITENAKLIENKDIKPFWNDEGKLNTPETPPVTPQQTIPEPKKLRGRPKKIIETPIENTPGDTIEAPKLPETIFKKENPHLAQAIENAETPKPVPEIIKNLGDGTPDLAAPPTVPPKPPKMDDVPPPKMDGPTPLYVEHLEKLTGKVNNMTYMHSPAEMWAEVIRLSEANEGFNKERPHISKQDSLNAAKELLGDQQLDIFKVLQDKLGVTGDRLSTVVSGALYQYNKEGVQLHTLASDFNEKLMKFGKDHPETLKALVAYAQDRLRFTAIMKSFYGSRSEVGRSLAMLKPDLNESPEQYLMRLAKDMNGPEGLQGDGAIILCG